MKKILLMFSLFALTQQTAWSAGLEPPSSTALTVTPGEPGQLLVRWQDWTGERGYRVYSTTATNPGGVFVDSSDWTAEAELPKDTTSFSFFAFSPKRVVICALNEVFSVDTNAAIACTQYSALVTPEPLPDTARIRDLRVVAVGKNFVEVAWVESVSTRRSEISIAPGAQVVIDDSNEVHRFTNLAPGTIHTIKGCVKSNLADPGPGVCSSITQVTLPDAPTSIDSIALIPSSTPGRQTVEFTHSVPRERQVEIYDVNLFRDGGNAPVESKRVDGGSGNITRRVTFSDLSPFTWHEIWVIPINLSGGAEGKGIGFTTPNQVSFTSTPLSGNSVLVEFDAKTIGRYTIEKPDGSGFLPIGSVQVLQPNMQRVVIDNVSGQQSIRLTWALAHLTSSSESEVVRPASRGAPELINGSIKSKFFFGDSSSSEKIVSASFKPTQVHRLAPGLSAPSFYVLVADRLTGPRSNNGPRRQRVTLASLTVPAGHDGSPLSISSELLGIVSNVRVCKTNLTNAVNFGRLQCSASLESKSMGLSRFSL